MSSDNNNNNISGNDEPNQSRGQYHSVKGTLVEAVGSLTGAKTWVDSGRQEHADGESEINQAQAKGYVEGLSDRVQGKYDAVAGAVTGDKTQQASGNAQHDKGQLKQKLNEPK